MFDFQKEVIINSAVVDGDYPKVKYANGVLKVARCADYLASNVTDIKKVEAKSGVAETIKLANVGGKGITKIVIEVGLDETRMYGEYANDWARFCKTVIAECETTGTAATDLQIIMKALATAIPENNKFLKLKKGGDGNYTGEISCIDSHQILKVVEISLSEDNGETFVVKQTKANFVGEGYVERVPELGTAAWLTENLRFPTYPNLRYAALHQEERPIEGATYTQYSFEYISPRKGLHGQGTVGQKLESVTTHIFYVLDTLSTVITEFENFKTAVNQNSEATE